MAELGNKNAEKYDEATATALFDDAIKLAKTGEYDFIGEVAVALNTYRDLFTYLVDKFPQLKSKYKELLSTVESSCFSNAKKGKIKDSLAIVNLKSNHGWTDRQKIENNITGSGITIQVRDPELGNEVERVQDRTN